MSTTPKTSSAAIGPRAEKRHKAENITLKSRAAGKGTRKIWHEQQMGNDGKRGAEISQKPHPTAILH